jgi:hypothetical protein
LFGLKSGRSDRPVELGGLVFLALGGVVALFQGLPDAVGRLRVSRASLAGLARLPRPVPDPLPRPLADLLADDLVHASAASPPQPARLTRPNSALSGL